MSLPAHLLRGPAGELERCLSRPVPMVESAQAQLRLLARIESLLERQTVALEALAAAAAPAPPQATPKKPATKAAPKKAPAPKKAAPKRRTRSAQKSEA